MIPLGTDQQARRTPVATIGIVALTVAAFLVEVTVLRRADEATAARFEAALALSRAHFSWWQPVTYQFLHDPGSLWHLLGNMLFLWVFGAPVEGRLGRLGFLAFYLSGGAVAGLAHLALNGAPVIGASGAVSAVTGAFIVLCPRARVAMLLWFSIIPVPALLVVALYFVLDLFGALGARGGVAHLAHLGGTLYGVSVTAVLLATGLVKRTDLDMVFLIKQWRRRAEMRDALRGTRTGAPWESAGAGGDTRIAALPVGAGAASAPTPQAEALAARRVAKRLADEAGAAFHRGDFAAALEGFRGALAKAPDAPDADQTRLMVALILARKLPDAAAARAALGAVGTALPAHLEPLRTTLRQELGA